MDDYQSKQICLKSSLFSMLAYIFLSSINIHMYYIIKNVPPAF